MNGRRWSLATLTLVALACSPSSKAPTAQAPAPPAATIPPPAPPARPARRLEDCFRGVTPDTDLRKIEKELTACMNEALDAGLPVMTPAQLEALMALASQSDGGGARLTDAKEVVDSMRIGFRIFGGKLAGICKIAPIEKAPDVYTPAAPFTGSCVPVTGTFQDARPSCPPSVLEPKCLEVIQRRTEKFSVRITIAANGEPTAVQATPRAAKPEPEERALLCIFKHLPGRFFLGLEPCAP